MSIDWKDNLSFIDPKEHKDIQITGFLDPDKYLRIPEIYFNALEKRKPRTYRTHPANKRGNAKVQNRFPNLSPESQNDKRKLWEWFNPECRQRV
jgi:hypothetical protein